jgi:AraC family transcriptional regulator of adaptative response/methylated-DNA-[protein]-cysteine methyltransferase
MDTASTNLTTLREWLLEANYAPILETAEKKKGILSQLTALSYEEDAGISERAIEATGLAARIIARRDPEYVRNYLLRLFWLINDESGGICWRAPELIGEILYHCPQFNQFFPMLISLFDLEEEDAPRFRAGTLWAIGRVAQVAREGMLPALQQVRTYISGDNEIQIKEMADWCVQQLIADKE